MWVITRTDNSITGGGGPIIDAIATEVFQIAYIMITAVVIAKERVDKPQMIKEKS